jgi:transcriptional regulator
MYLPQHFRQDDPALLLEVMQRYNFATLVSTVNDAPFATHLPVLARLDGDAIHIEGHFARANPHWQALEAEPQALIIFHGPHTYISPTLYRDSNRVPTWNYIAVHARGLVRIRHEADAKLAMLDKLIEQQEPAYQNQFEQIDDTLRTGLLNAIVAFDMQVQTLEGKFKLGQHRLAGDKPEMQSWHQQGDENQRALAQWMQRLGYWQ